jgi:hypothetical protein
MILQSSLMLLVVGVTVVACVTAIACIQTVSRHSCCCWSFKFLMVSCCWSLCYCDVPGVTNGAVGVSAIPFEHGAGGPAVTGFPAVDGVLAVASVPADPYVHFF